MDLHISTTTAQVLSTVNTIKSTISHLNISSETDTMDLNSITSQRHVSFDEAELQEFEACSKDYIECQAEHYIYLIGAPLLMLLALVGNSLTLTVMLRPKLRRTATAMFISALAVSDTVANITGLIRHFIMRASMVDIRTLSTGACRIHRFLLYLSLDTSSWILVLVTIERFVAVCYPLTHKKFRKPMNAVKGIVAVLVFQIAFNMHVFFTRGKQAVIHSNETSNNTIEYTELVCGYTSETAVHYWTYVQGWLSMLIYCILPFIAMLIFNVFIIRKLREMSNSMLTRNISQLSTTGITQQTKSMTYMLLSVTIYFIVVTTPVFIFTMVETVKLHNTSLDRHYHAKLQLADAITTMLFYLNHSINFFLYCLTGRRFRKELKAMCGCLNAFRDMKASLRGDREEVKLDKANKISITAEDSRHIGTEYPTPTNSIDTRLLSPGETTTDNNFITI